MGNEIKRKHYIHFICFCKNIAVMQQMPTKLSSKTLKKSKKKAKTRRRKIKIKEKKFNLGDLILALFIIQIFHTHTSIIVSLFFLACCFLLFFYIINFNHEKNFYKQLHKSNAEMKRERENRNTKKKKSRYARIRCLHIGS